MARTTLKKEKQKRAKRKSKVLHVESVDKIRSMEEMLRGNSVKIVLIFAHWCGACQKFMKNIWGPMCKSGTPAQHERIAVRDDMVGKTSLSNAKFQYLPSIIIVDEKGELQNFKTPDGQITNAMPTPKSLSDMKRIVNVPVSPVSNNTTRKNSLKTPKTISLANNYANANANSSFTMNVVNNRNNTRNNRNNSRNSKKNTNTNTNRGGGENLLMTQTSLKPVKNRVATPAGNVYIPTPMAAPKIDLTKQV